jgi:hypothetical protein
MNHTDLRYTLREKSDVCQIYVYMCVCVQDTNSSLNSKQVVHLRPDGDVIGACCDGVQTTDFR